MNERNRQCQILQYLFVFIAMATVTAIAALSYNPGDPLPPYFAPPWEIYDGNKPFFTVGSGDGLPLEAENGTLLYNVTINDTDRYVYNTVYASLDGGAWQPFVLDTELSPEGWTTEATVLAIQVPAEIRAGYVIVYSCKKFDNEWRCGCRDFGDCDRWAINQLPLPAAPPAAQDCRQPSVSCPSERPFCNVATGTCDECMTADTQLCQEREVCEGGECTPVQCLTNIDCVGIVASGLRRSVCHPREHICVACNTNADCIYRADGTADVSGTCDFGTHLCKYVEHCIDKCMPDDVLGYGGVGRCEGNVRYACLKDPDSICFDQFPVETCSGTCEKFGAVAYCSNNPHPCGRSCGADINHNCNPYCGSGMDMFCPDVDPDCTQG